MIIKPLSKSNKRTVSKLLESNIPNLRTDKFEVVNYNLGFELELEDGECWEDARQVQNYLVVHGVRVTEEFIIKLGDLK